MNSDPALTTFRPGPGTRLVQVTPSNDEPVTLDSPALDVMTDLTRVKAATTSPASSLRQAEQTMIYQGVRMLFVVTDMPSIVGLITATDLRGDRAMQVVQQRQVRYDELTVAEVMTELAALDAIEYAQLRTATVGSAVATLKRVGRNHLLVIEAANATERVVRGVISRSQIERQLGRPVEVTPIASSFSEIERALL